MRGSQLRRTSIVGPVDELRMPTTDPVRMFESRSRVSTLLLVTVHLTSISPTAHRRVSGSEGIGITVQCTCSPFRQRAHRRLSGSDGFGPRLPGLRERRVGRSRRARKPSSPSGRPMLSAARRRPNRSASASGSLAMRSAKFGKRSLIGFQRGDAVILVAQMRTRARPPPILCPSPSRARTGLSDT